MSYDQNVFVNCPFDQEYFPLLRAILFTTIFCGLKPQISETRDSETPRITRIKELVKNSKFSIHDISRVTNNHGDSNQLPRFNMPFELGIDVGCKSFGNCKEKVLLILEEKPYRYQQVLSDISGQDIRIHNAEPIKVVKSIRDWSKIAFNSEVFKDRKIGSYKRIWDAYNEFGADFQSECQQEGIKFEMIWELPFSELTDIMTEWIVAYKSN